MRKYIILLLSVFQALISLGQLDYVLDEINKANNLYIQANKEIEESVYYLDKYKSSNTLSSMQQYLKSAIGEIESAVSYCQDAVEEMKKAENNSSYENCWESKRYSNQGKIFFNDAGYNASQAIEYFNYASNSTESSELIDYANNGIDFLVQSLADLDNGKAAIINVLNAVKMCVDELRQKEKDVPSCEELISFIKSNGYILSSVYSYTLNSNWLNEVKAYRYDYKIYVIAKIKTDDYGYSFDEYIFCNIPEEYWNKFRQIDLYGNTTYGERFHSYIFPYRCNCK